MSLISDVGTIFSINDLIYCAIIIKCPICIFYIDDYFIANYFNYSLLYQITFVRYFMVLV